MTETEWLACTQPQPMLDYLQDSISDRKLRLFAAACCRQVMHLLPDEQFRTTLDAAERFADGLISKKKLSAAFSILWPAIEHRLEDHIIQQGSLPYTRPYAGMAVAATSAVGRGRSPWLATWQALHPVNERYPHSPPWEYAAWALRSAASEVREFGIDVISKDPEQVEAHVRAWDEAEARAHMRIEQGKIRWSKEYDRLVESGVSGIDAVVGAMDKASGRIRREKQFEAERRAELKRSFEAEKRAEEQAIRHQCELVRDLVGNPFLPTRVKPAWLRWNDSTVVRLAQAIYADHRFEDMPILADALEEAGCDNPDILRHCRLGGSHVRGCWVLDLLLGKE